MFRGARSSNVVCLVGAFHRTHAGMNIAESILAHTDQSRALRLPIILKSQRAFVKTCLGRRVHLRLNGSTCSVWVTKKEEKKSSFSASSFITLSQSLSSPHPHKPLPVLTSPFKLLPFHTNLQVSRFLGRSQRRGAGSAFS
ncbi:hypothetical protein JTE90_024796 [Oedothorax gibbosus]|uniref:Uncharacterized protein n=1 Tax=Oedothorax gibbosus TaxID=931172 RepID=A0AAV6TYY0_9ARAC|nr:hypothetical protein JTE90_024796 [Oedothorax gibbosus]